MLIEDTSGRDPFNQNFRKFRSKTQWIGSVQPEKFRKKRVHLLRWTTFPGRTGWNFLLNGSRPVSFTIYQFYLKKVEKFKS